MNSFQLGVIEQLKSKRRKMSPGQRAKTRQPKLKGVFLYPFGVETSYALFIKNIIKQFTETATAAIERGLPLWHEEFNRLDSYGADWARINKELLDVQKEQFEKNSSSFTAAIFSFGEDTEKWNSKQNEKFVKQILAEPVFPQEAWLPSVLQSWENENMGLIKGLSEDYIKKINSVVSTGLQTGAGIGEIKKGIRRVGEEMTGSRARLIARDQVGKLNGVITKRRNEELGLNLYEWSTSMDERVRSNHRPMNGKLCRWDDASVYSDDGGKTWKSRSSIGAVQLHPGMDIQCRCTSIPVFSDLLLAADKELAKEEGKPAPVSVPTPAPKEFKPAFNYTEHEIEKLRDAGYWGPPQSRSEALFRSQFKAYTEKNYSEELKLINENAVLKKAMKDYTGDDFERINGNLRKGIAGDPEPGILSEFINEHPLKDDMYLYRGASRGMIKKYKELPTGATELEPGFSSTTVSPASALSHSARNSNDYDPVTTVIRIKAKKGNPYSPPFRTEKEGFNMEETEFLGDYGIVYKKIGVSRDDYLEIDYIDVEVVE